MVMKSKFLPWVSIGTKLCVSAEEEYKLRHMFSIHSGFLHPPKKWIQKMIAINCSVHDEEVKCSQSRTSLYETPSHFQGPSLQSSASPTPPYKGAPRECCILV